MTRSEFAEYVFEGEQWTDATLTALRMAQAGMIPKCDVETFEREALKPGGFIEYELAAPLFVFR